MEFYLTAPDGSRIHLPVTPEKITVQTESKMETFEVISLGKIDIPRGRVSMRISWEGFFPGEARKNSPFVIDWRPPKEMVEIISRWKDKGTKVRLLVTETPINYDCYISSFEHTWGGGYGDCQYTIELVEARELVVYTESEKKSKQQLSKKRPSPPP
ncbi:peptidoglycan-binding protein LysM, partial [Carboxydocella sp. ULO1]